MSDMARIILQPSGKVIEVGKGTPLQDVLFAHGVEFPCGGKGRCKGCRVRVLDGDIPITPEMQRLLGDEELRSGWRLSCQAAVTDNLTLELAQWEVSILSDNRRFAFEPREGLGIAVDLGTTTLVAQLLDMQTANVLAVSSSLNAQARYGADIMSRVEYAVAGGGQKVLTQTVRSQIGDMIKELLNNSGCNPSKVRRVILVGNTVMHHLFCGIDLEPLAHHPFTPADADLKKMSPEKLDWPILNDKTEVWFLPCLGGFVGSDILAGIMATGMSESDDLSLLVDLGTNGEIVLGNRQRMLCASTAAGPAFEGARISCGMRAATGAISAVTIRDGRLVCSVIGRGSPKGICGSGLVDAVAAGLEIGAIKPSGRLAQGMRFPLEGDIALGQCDIRELQLAKGATAAGMRLLLKHWGATYDDVQRVFLAGAFGNYINRSSARRIGLLNFPMERILPSGNTALLGAKLALFNLDDSNADCRHLRSKIQHVSLNEDAEFQEVYGEEMLFPAE